MKNLLIGVALGVFAQTAVADNAPNLFMPAAAASANGRVAAAPVATPGTTAVRLNIAALAALPLQAQANFILPGSKGSHAVVFDRLETAASGNISWIGHLKDHGKNYRAILTSGPDGAYGRILTPEGEFRLHSVAGNQWLIDTASANLQPFIAADDDSLAPPLSSGLAATAGAGGSSAAAAPLAEVAAGVATGVASTAPTPNSTIDVMVLYTPGMITALGSVAAVQTRIDNLIAIANQAYLDSEVAIQISLVHAEQVAYSDSVDIYTALDELKKGSDPALAGVAALRNAYGADMVSLLRPYLGAPYCGLAYVLGTNNTPISNYPNFAYSAVADGAASNGYYCSDYTFAHEFGHNMGSKHDRVTSGQPSGASAGAYPYSFGYGLDYAFTTIMGYPSSFRRAPGIGRFSNPLINTCLGLSCGISASYSNSANNALSLNNTRQDVANFRMNVATCSAALSATSQAVDYGSAYGAPVTITTPAGCPWNAVSNASWINVVSSASGSGNGSVYYYVSANVAAASRIGTLIVAGQIFTITQVGVTSGANKVDIRTYVPAAAAASGYTSYLRIINTGSVATPVSVAIVGAANGVAGLSGQLIATLPAGAAKTFSAAQVEAVLGSVPADLRPRVRVFAAAAATIEVQSFLLQPGGAFNEVSGAGSGSTITIRTYVPAAAAPSGYVSHLRIINTGQAATTLTVARIDPVTGITGTPRLLNTYLPVAAAATYTAAQIEAAMGITIGADERPRLLVSGTGSTLDAQSFLIQPGGAFTEVSSGKSGTSIDVPSYVPAATSGYKTFIRVMNTSATAAPVMAAMLDDTGAAGVPRTIIDSLAGFAAKTLTSDQIEAALGVSIAAADRPRIRVSSAAATLDVQSFLLQPGGAFNEISNAITGTSVVVRTYVPAADSPGGYTSYLRVINTGNASTPVTVALVDGDTGVRGSPAMLVANMAAGAAQTFNSSQIEAALGSPIAAGSRPRIALSANTVLEVQSFLTQPGGAFTEVSGGQ